MTRSLSPLVLPPGIVLTLVEQPLAVRTQSGGGREPADVKRDLYGLDFWMGSIIWLDAVTDYETSIEEC
jgi:hypothetical protein